MPFFKLTLTIVLFFAVGCAKEQIPRPINPDPLFSLNVAEVPPDWPLEEKDWSLNPYIAAQQQRTYQLNGIPDYFYIFWNRDGRPITNKEFSQEQWVNRNNNRRREGPQDIGWIYLDQEKVFRFSRRGIQELDLTDQIETIIDYGDPEDIKTANDTLGDSTTIYTYYSEGKVYTFKDGVLIREENQPVIDGFYMKH